MGEIIQSKKVVAVTPYLRDSGSNFKMQPYYAWKKVGGMEARAHYPFERLHFFAYRIDCPTFVLHKREARFRFAEAQSITFDTFPDYLCYEIIPLIWDCWPALDERVVIWLRKHKVKSCVFTSCQAAERIKLRLPYLNILTITEGIDVSRYNSGKNLSDRSIDFYTYGRLKKELFDFEIEGIQKERGGAGELLFERLGDSKITVALPQCDVNPDYTGGQETLTQRFWECMLSRTVLLGRSPKELIDLIGYDPVVPIDYEHYAKQIKDIVANIEDYQSLVDKNRETALRMAPWEIRMKQVMEWLESLGYEVK